MDSLIGISVQGKTYFFHNTFSTNQLSLLKYFVENYRKANLFIEYDDNDILNKFILEANAYLKCSLQLVPIDEILVLK